MTQERHAMFDRAPLIQERVSLEDVLNLIRKVTNRKYMPTATGEVNFNSKPYYVPTAHPVFSNYPMVTMVSGAGYLAFDAYSVTNNNQTIFAQLEIDDYIILVDLKNCSAIVGIMLDSASYLNYHWVEWPLDENFKLSIDRKKLDDIINLL